MKWVRIGIRRIALAAALALVASACGGGGEVATTTTSAATTTTQATTTTTAGLAVTTLDGVRDAVVRIVAEGSFVDPEVGLQLNAAGSGSGFIIDESGLAVTNNHVVTGAALLQVYRAGSDEPLNARVLGASECSDLALIDIEGDGFPYLQWHEGELKVGIDAFAAGFPLGDPEFTLTRGIISKAQADGETSWASVDHVIEHDATINPGNSGGPLVDADGRVLGVNYAGASSTNQYFAIARDQVLPVIDAIQSGGDIDTLGINGEAVVSEADGISGIWVASVQSGSPADDVGILAGDIVTRLEGLLLATDGTMADYCDILRSHGPDDVLAVEVLRYDTGEVLEGRINGSPLETSFSFREELAGEVGDGSAGGTGGTGDYTDYVTVTDDSGVISVDVPAEWSDVDGRAFEGVGPSVAASPDVQSFYDGFTVPGVEVTATKNFAPDELLDVLGILTDGLPCDVVGDPQDYSDPLYTGLFQVIEDCGGTATDLLYVVAAPEEGDFLVIVVIQVVTDADLAALDRILETFVVTGDF